MDKNPRPAPTASPKMAARAIAISTSVNCSSVLFLIMFSLPVDNDHTKQAASHARHAEDQGVQHR